MARPSPVIPVIDVSPLCRPSTDATASDVAAVAAAIGRACREVGFFYVRGWEAVVDPGAAARLERLARSFFARPVADKMSISMKRSGLHWKGYFPSGDELTSGKPDAKEGIYFGEDYPLTDPRVQQGWPMHGPNQFPEPAEEWGDAVTAYMAALTELGTRLMRGVALSLGLPADYFNEKFCRPRPFTPFRIFHYPGTDARQGVGRHTDYGVLTILWTDDVAGLEVETTQRRWVSAPPIPGTFIVNIGDMLELWTGGAYKATPHRVRPGLEKSRISMPFFFDPSFETWIDPAELVLSSSRQAKAAVLRNAAGEEEGVLSKPIRYKDYITHKVSHVFPELFAEAGGADELLSKL